MRTARSVYQRRRLFLNASCTLPERWLAGFSHSRARGRCHGYRRGMDVFLSHTTALEALRRWELRHRLARGERCDAAVPAAAPEPDELAEALRRLPFLAQSPSLEVICASGRPGLRRSGALVHLDRAPLPPKSAFRLAEGVVCSSPELLAVQLAPSLTELELDVLLGELLGTYAICPTAEDGMFQRREPLTTPARMLAYLDALGPRAGTGLVRRALGRAHARSGSPRETKLALRLALKPSRGGWNLNVLAMNAPVTVRRLGKAFETGTRKPDLLIGRPGATSAEDLSKVVAVEYNGRRHDTPARIEQDATRSNELKAQDVSEYILRSKHYEDLDYMDDIVACIRSDLGLPRIGMTRETADERRRLRRELYEELERIDGVHWNGRERERRRRSGGDDRAFEVVPVEAYGLD